MQNRVAVNLKSDAIKIWWIHMLKGYFLILWKSAEWDDTLSRRAAATVGGAGEARLLHRHSLLEGLAF